MFIVGANTVEKRVLKCLLASRHSKERGGERPIYLLMPNVAIACGCTRAVYDYAAHKFRPFSRSRLVFAFCVPQLIAFG